jgi:hypothetical protein
LREGHSEGSAVSAALRKRCGGGPTRGSRAAGRRFCGEREGEVDIIE